MQRETSGQSTRDPMSHLIQINPASVTGSPSLTGKQYWRSLNDLADKPEFRDWVDREFPEGASEMLNSGSRRSMLKLMAASFGLAGLSACRRPAIMLLRSPAIDTVEDRYPDLGACAIDDTPSQVKPAAGGVEYLAIG